MKHTTVLLATLTLILGMQGKSRADLITLTSNTSTTLTASVGPPGPPSDSVLNTLDTGDTSGLTFVPAIGNVGGTFTSPPPGSPAGTTVINIPPGDGENGFYEMTFTLPNGYSNPQLFGSANVDDGGRVFLNGNPISPSQLGNDPNQLTEFGNATFSTSNASFFQPGTNVFLISDSNRGAGPSGAAFYAYIATDGTPLPAAPEPSSLALLGMATASLAGYRGWRRRQSIVRV